MTSFLPCYLLVTPSKDQLVKLLVRIARDPGNWQCLQQLKHSQGFSSPSFPTLSPPSTFLLLQDHFWTQLLQPPLLKEALGHPLAALSLWTGTALPRVRRTPDTSPVDNQVITPHKPPAFTFWLRSAASRPGNGGPAFAGN